MSTISVVEPEAPGEPVQVSTAAPTAAPMEAPVAIPAEAPAPQIVTVVEKPSRLARVLPIAAVSLAVLASFLSVIGLTVASRTVASASLVVADARERQAQLVQIGAMIKEVEALRVREEAALARMERFRSTTAATTADVNRAMDNLKQDLAQHQPEEGPLSLVRAGQSELAERIGQISLKLERIEQAVKPNAGRTPVRHP